MRLLLLVFFFIGSFLMSYAQQEARTLQAHRIQQAPKIDGLLDDQVWANIAPSGDFVMFEPGNEGVIPEDKRSEVKMAYDDKAIYIAAYLYHDNPELIASQFSQRDEVFVQADNFVVALNTYDDGLNETRFYVTSAGTIGDQIVTQNSQDFGFNVVFDCRISQDAKGWYAEFKIPYNALRFPEAQEQKWSVNFYRRLVNENQTHTWSFIDRAVGRDTQYNGKITGVRDIDAPVRLTFFPFAQAVTSFADGESASTFTGGLDIKYGLTDSFTLDAQLIPDFGQVAFDEVRLNLGPFEQAFGENRPFFTEGIDLFQKGRIFFSRRIGGEPSGGVELAENEEINELPSSVRLLNSLKISGRTKNGLGIGFLNSIGDRTVATTIDTITGLQRETVVEPLANYNVFVLDQQFNNNSSVSLINTSVLRSGSQFRNANVTAAVFDISDKGNNYRAAGRTVLSNVRELGETASGFQSELDLLKISGSWRYRIGHDFADRTIDINDLGLLFRNNFNNFTLGGSYELIQPTETFNGYRVELTVRHRRLYQPSVVTRNSINLNSFFFTKERFAFGASASYNGIEQDFFEPRIEGRFVTFDANLGVGGFISTDFRKKFAIDLNLDGRTWFNEIDEQQTNYSIEFSPRYRFSDRFLLILSSEYEEANNNFGWVDNTATDVFLGLRDITSLENTITASYNFDSYKAIDLRLRNFWSTADHSSNVFYLLNEDGSRTQIDDYDFNERRNPNTNFNIWNMDLSFRWRFAPGSEASLLYRNTIFNSDELSTLSYTESLGNLFDQTIRHTLSLRVTYFIDYNNINDVFKNPS